MLYNDRTVVPLSLQKQVMENLHSTHQGVACMASQVLSTVYGPGNTSSIEKAIERCRSFHRNALSQAKLSKPTVPFKIISSDYFKQGAHFYLVTDCLVFLKWHR